MFVQKNIQGKSISVPWYRKLLTPILAIICVLAIFFVGRTLLVYAQAALGFLSANTVEVVSKNFGQDMQKDSFWNINILLIGHGWIGHDGWLLADTIIVASRNPEKNAVTMISVPRDLYVDIPEHTISGRINYVFAAGYQKFGTLDGAAKMLSQEIYDLTSLKIPYYAVVDFGWFKDVVDAVGGVDVNVPERIYDTTYPNAENRGYETFYVERWLQHFDGETALKYARSRHTTSDFSRSARQQQIIQAIITKLLSSPDIRNVSTIKKLYEQYTTMVKTNIGLKEIIGMLQYVFSLQHIFNFGLTSECGYRSYESSKPGCFLYVPSRDAFNGASVMIVNGATPSDLDNYTYTQNFGYLVAHNQGYLIEAARLGIKNGITKDFARSLGKNNEGQATQVGVKLVKYGFMVVDAANAETGSDTTRIIIYGTWEYPETISALQKFLPIPTVVRDANVVTWLDMELILWNDYLQQLTGSFNYNM